MNSKRKVTFKVVCERDVYLDGLLVMKISKQIASSVVDTVVQTLQGEICGQVDIDDFTEQLIEVRTELKAAKDRIAELEKQLTVAENW